jgi:hypothetical protein
MIIFLSGVPHSSCARADRSVQITQDYAIVRRFEEYSATQRNKKGNSMKSRAKIKNVLSQNFYKGQEEDNHPNFIYFLPWTSDPCLF